MDYLATAAKTKKIGEFNIQTSRDIKGALLVVMGKRRAQRAGAAASQFALGRASITRFCIVHRNFGERWAYRNYIEEP